MRSPAAANGRANRKVLIISSTKNNAGSESEQGETALAVELTGANTCTGVGITARSTAPVLALCRELLAVGLDPDRAMQVYRGATLALRIRSIGEAARLEINGEGTGFRPARLPDAASPVRPNEEGGAM
jgi:hypothetical protein